MRKLRAGLGMKERVPARVGRGHVEAALRRRRWPWAVGFVVGCVAALIVAFTHPMLPKTAALLVSLATGMHAQFDDVTITPSRITASGIVLRSRAGPLIFSAPHAEIAYDLRAWRSRSYGLVAVSLDRPVVHVERLAGGRWNIGALSRGGGNPQGGGVPLWLSMRVSDGTVELRNPSSPSVDARALDLAHLDLDLRAGEVWTSSTFTARAQLVDRGIAYPIAGSGSLSYARGDAVQHWWAKDMPIADLADFFIGSPTVQVTDGTAHDLHAALFAVGLQPGVPPEYHLSGSADLRNGALDVSVLSLPISHLRGQLLLFDGGFLTRTARADVGDMPLAVHGGIFGITSGTPQLRLGVDGSANLSAVKEIFNFSQHQPISGKTRLAVRILGSTDDPLIVTNLAAPSAQFANIPLRHVRGVVSYHHDAVSFGPILGSYGPIDLALGGSLKIGAHVQTEVALSAAAPSDALPYAARFAANPRIQGALRLSGTDLTFDGDAFLRGEGGDGSTFAAVSYDRERLLLSPLRVLRSDGSALWAGAAIDQRTHRLAMWATAHDAELRTLKGEIALPGLVLPVLPALSGRFDARFAAEGKQNDLALSGALAGRRMQLGPLALDEASGRVAGAGTQIDVYDAFARGPWGNASLHGGYDAEHQILALRGPYHADLAGARLLLANTPASGRAAGDLAVVVRPQRTLVQVTGRAVGRDEVRGIPLDAGFATIGIDGTGTDVYAASAQVAGGSAAAAGRFAPGASLQVAARDIQVAQLKATGVPLDTGRVLLLGNAQPAAHGALRFSGGLALVGSSLFGEGVSGSAHVDLVGDRVTVAGASGSYDGTWASASGTIAGLGLRAPRMDLSVDVRALDVAPWARRLGYGTLYAQGNVSARFHLQGTAADPRAGGTARMGFGSVHGMDFTDLGTTFEASLHDASLREGSVTVGGSHLAFGATADGGSAGFSVRGRGLDLADFDQWFDAFDVLQGKGNVDIAAGGIGRSLSGHADVQISDLRVRELPFGTLRTAVVARNNVVRGSVGLGDAALGTLVVRGSAALPRNAGLTSPLAYARETQAHLAGDLDRFQLARWLPAVGIGAPVVGAVSGNFTLDGRYPKARFAGKAQLSNGVVDKVPIDRLALAFDSNFVTTHVTSAELELANLSATGSGTVGPGRRLALGVHLRSPNVHNLVYTAAHRNVDINASGEADLHVAG
ncbi:MAG: hypothetical protein KGM44_03625, partial [bacterium]|nr:hypothetical protein [bacterium]